MTPRLAFERHSRANTSRYRTSVLLRNCYLLQYQPSLSMNPNGIILDDPVIKDMKNAIWRVVEEQQSNCEDLRMSYRPHTVEIRFSPDVQAGYRIERPLLAHGQVKGFSSSKKSGHLDQIRSLDCEIFEILFLKYHQSSSISVATISRSNTEMDCGVRG